MKQPAVYIVANKRNGTLYTGVTSNLAKRAYEHKEGIIEGFTKKYGCKLLVFYELHETMDSAISREKQIKGGSRQKISALSRSNQSKLEKFIHRYYINFLLYRLLRRSKRAPCE